MSDPSRIPHASEADERARLSHVTRRVRSELMQFDALVRRKHDEALAIKSYLNDHKSKSRIEGIPVDTEIKHLVIDEMQDYSAIQYRVLGELFPCRKTVLGDAHQSVNPLSSSSAATISRLLPGARRVTLNQSYRSTVQITRFSLRVRPNPDLVPIERHGEEPAVHACAAEREQTLLLKRWLHEFLDSEHQTLGIICKTQKQANALHRKLMAAHDDLHLLDARSTNYDAGVIVATAHLVKGLEFDEVIVPDAGGENYQTDVDRQMLYVACTRAMHRLRLSHTGEPSRFLA